MAVDIRQLSFSLGLIYGKASSEVKEKIAYLQKLLNEEQAATPGSAVKKADVSFQGAKVQDKSGRVSGSWKLDPDLESEIEEINTKVKQANKTNE